MNSNRCTTAGAAAGDHHDLPRATERRALDGLVRKFGAEVRISLLDGLEWNVRISAIATPVLVRKFEATFGTYWNDPDLRPYDPDRDAELLDAALTTEGGSGGAITLAGLEVRPRPYQEQILEALDAERTVHDRHRNLVVATGTGKTVVAAHLP